MQFDEATAAALWGQPGGTMIQCEHTERHTLAKITVHHGARGVVVVPEYRYLGMHARLEDGAPAPMIPPRAYTADHPAPIVAKCQCGTWRVHPDGRRQPLARVDDLNRLAIDAGTYSLWLRTEAPGAATGASLVAGLAELEADIVAARAAEITDPYRHGERVIAQSAVDALEARATRVSGFTQWREVRPQIGES